MIELRDVSVSLGSNRIIGSLSATVASGEWVALLGPNGAGKTTLVRAIAGLVPHEGSIVVEGTTIGHSTRRQVSKLIALVPQQPQIPLELPVGEYVLLGRTPHIAYLATESRDDRLAAERAIARLGLQKLVDRPLGSLSGGELQRAVLAKALAQEAPVLLLDEPTSALDLGRQQQALELVDELRRDEPLTVVSAMHDVSLAGQYADRLLLLDAGEVVAEGTAHEVLSEERISQLYGANVRVVHENGSVFVLPKRA